MYPGPAAGNRLWRQGGTHAFSDLLGKIDSKESHSANLQQTWSMKSSLAQTQEVLGATLGSQLTISIQLERPPKGCRQVQSAFIILDELQARQA